VGSSPPTPSNSIGAPPSLPIIFEKEGRKERKKKEREKREKEEEESPS